MATASELISNKGDAGLGFGSNANIPMGTGTDFDKLADIGNQIMLQNMAQNKYLFDQKIKDRDKLLEQINSGDIEVGDLLEEDMPIVKEGLEGLDNAWEEYNRKGINNLDAQKVYRKAVREAKDRVTKAQERKLFYDTETAALAKDTLPRRQEARKKNLDANIKGGFYKNLMPYQQMLDLDINKDIKADKKDITTTFTDPNTLKETTTTLFDFDKTRDETLNSFRNDETKRNSQMMLMGEVQKLPPGKFEAEMKKINARIKEYNDFNKLSAGQDGFVEDAKWQINLQTGLPMIDETPNDFAAKYILSQEKPFGSSSEKYNVPYLLGKERNKIAAMRAGAYVALQRKKLSKLNDEEKQIKGFWDGVVDRIKERKTHLLSYDANGNPIKKDIGNQDYIMAGDLPKGYTYMAGVNADGKPIKLKPKVTKRKDGSTFEYYSTRYNHGQTGEPVDKAFLTDKYNLYKSNGGKGNYDAYVKELIKGGVVDLEVVGENGTADFNTALQSARAISGKIGSGKEERVYEDIREDETVIENP